jgi:prolyl 4-hydroxylase
MRGKLIVVVLILLIIYLLPSYPKPRVMRNFLSESERRHIISEATNKLETSTISHSKTVDENIRKSETAWLDKDDKVVRNVINRCLKHTDRPITNCEKLQVLKYKSGGHYKPHQDAFKDDESTHFHYGTK